jgi:AcrR family transcriptional regulator
LSDDRCIAGDYFEVARQVLADAGHAGLRITELCRRLGVSKGSFYHHFESRPAFVAAFLGEWENSFGHWWATTETVEPPARINAMFDLLADEMTGRLDAAVRTWGQSDPTVARAVVRRDDTIAYAIEQTLSLFIADQDRRWAVAQVSLNAWAGGQARGSLEREYVLRLAVEISRSCWGVPCALAQEDGRLVARVVPDSTRTTAMTRPTGRATS